MNALMEAVEVLNEMESLAQRVQRQREAEQDQDSSEHKLRIRKAVKNVIDRTAAEREKADAEKTWAKDTKSAAENPAHGKHQPAGHVGGLKDKPDNSAVISAAISKHNDNMKAKQTQKALEPKEGHSAGHISVGGRKFKLYTGKSLSDNQRNHNRLTLHNLHRHAADRFREAASDQAEGSAGWKKLMDRAHHHDSKADEHYRRLSQSNS